MGRGSNFYKWANDALSALYSFMSATALFVVYFPSLGLLKTADIYRSALCGSGLAVTTVARD